MAYSSTSLTVYRLAGNFGATIAYDQMAPAGRWNLAGTKCLYASGSIAQAILEVSIHTDFEILAMEMQVVAYTIAGESLLHWEAMEDLPKTALGLRYHSECQQFGTKVLNESGKLALAFPSIVVPGETIYLINTAHNAFNRVKTEVLSSLMPL